MRDALVRSILNVLGEQLLASFQELLMKPDSIPESPAFRAMRLKLEAHFEAKGEAKGEARALLLVLESRGIAVDDASRQRIAACEETAQLERWVRRAASVTRIGELFED